MGFKQVPKKELNAWPYCLTPYVYDCKIAQYATVLKQRCDALLNASPQQRGDQRGKNSNHDDNYLNKKTLQWDNRYE